MANITVRFQPAQGRGWNIDIIIGNFAVVTYTPLNHVVAERIAHNRLTALLREHPEWRQFEVLYEGLPETTE